jgi:hypothetical protein
MQRLYYLLIISALSAKFAFPGVPKGDLENATKISVSESYPLDSVALENDYVKVMANSTACSNAQTAGFGTRIIVALDKLTIESSKGKIRLNRGNVVKILSKDTPLFNVVIEYKLPKKS